MRLSLLPVFISGLLVLLAGCAAPGPTIGPELSYTVEKSINLGRGKLYEHSWDWLGERFPGERRQVELADRKAGKIVATVRSDVSLAYQEARPLRFRIQIQTAVDQYRLVFDQPMVALEGAWYPIDGPRRDVLRPQVIGLYEELTADYQAYVSQFATVPLEQLY